jgi:hypothetical protein
MWKSVKHVLLWSYERGSWQYDVLCLLILAFIFLTPSRWFNEHETSPASPAAKSARPDSPRSTDPARPGGQKDNAESRKPSRPSPP